METSSQPPTDRPSLRGLAEARWRQQNSGPPFPRTEADTLRLVQELEVHQIELELQNAELERARDETAAAITRLTELYDFAPAAHLSLDANAHILEANLSCAALLNRERASLRGNRFTDFVVASQRLEFSRFLTLVFSGQTRRRAEITLQVDGNSVFDVEVVAMRSGTGRECRVALTDLTERQRAAADRLIAGKLESTGVLASGIAHDFNNLLMAVVLNLDLATQMADGNPELLRCLTDAKSTALAGRGLTSRLLTFSKGGTPICRLTLLPAVIRDAVRTTVSGSPVETKIALAHDLWPALIDQAQFEQVLRNLLLNAQEAMPNGGAITIRGENVLHVADRESSLPEGNYVRISITDQGEGIPPENLPRIFDPYFSTKPRGDHKGMGLGLTICHSIVLKHGGALTVRSTPGLGATFEILLPTGAIAAPPATPATGADRVSTRRILVMDDDEGVRRVCGSALRLLGHEVALVENGEAAVAAARAALEEGRPFHAALLDLSVRSGMGGAKALQVLRGLDPTIVAVVTSGYADHSVISNFRDYGFDGALAKPFDVMQLRESLARILSPATP